MFTYPAFADLLFVMSTGFFLYTFTRKLSLPFRMPMSSGVVDYNDLHPGTNKPNRARGITFFGNDTKTKEELWFTNEDMRTHVLIFGSTGSGKTEMLISISYSSLLQGSGFIFLVSFFAVMFFLPSVLSW